MNQQRKLTTVRKRIKDALDTVQTDQKNNTTRLADYSTAITK